MLQNYILFSLNWLSIPLFNSLFPAENFMMRFILIIALFMLQIFNDCEV